MKHTHLHFNSHVGRQKPESIRNRSTTCPFCDRDQLEEILAEDGSILLVKNKFPVLADTLQTVLIESDDCHSDLSSYPKEHLYRLIRFGVEQWLAMEASGEFTSVIFYKNHGPYSGGSIHHPHMQIVGLKHMDYNMHTADHHFDGLLIAEQPGVEFNISTKPRAGFFEFNIILTDRAAIDALADYIQVAADYMLHHFNKNCNSYNLFFYQHDGRIICKAVPRFVTSPLFVGYSIPQVASSIDEVVQAMRERYFAGE